MPGTPISSSPTTHFSDLEGTLPQFHTHPSDAYEIATLFLFSSFLYRRINSAPFSMRHRNTTHPPPTTRGQKKALALYFMYQIRKKKWSFSTPPFLWPLIQRPQNCPKKKLSTGFPDENAYRLGIVTPIFDQMRERPYLFAAYHADIALRFAAIKRHILRKKCRKYDAIHSSAWRLAGFPVGQGFHLP